MFTLPFLGLNLNVEFTGEGVLFHIGDPDLGQVSTSTHMSR